MGEKEYDIVHGKWTVDCSGGIDVLEVRLANEMVCRFHGLWTKSNMPIEYLRLFWRNNNIPILQMKVLPFYPKREVIEIVLSPFEIKDRRSSVFHSLAAGEQAELMVGLAIEKISNILTQRNSICTGRLQELKGILEK